MGLAPGVGGVSYNAVSEIVFAWWSKYSVQGVPWMEIEGDASRMNDSAFLYWQKS